LIVAFRSEAVKQSRGCGETRFGCHWLCRFVCHWLCQCSLRDVDKRFSTGRASGTQKRNGQLFFKFLVAFRSAKGNGEYRRLAATAYLKASHLVLYANQDKSPLVLAPKENVPFGVPVGI